MSRQTRPSPARFPVRGGLALLAAAAMAGSLPASAATAAPGRPAPPAHLQVTRTGADSTDLAIKWTAVPGVEHYTVNVFDGSKDRAVVIPADQTSYTFDGTGTCTRYQVRVSAIQANGGIGRTGRYYVGSLAPGAVTDIHWKGTTLVWGDPKLTGQTPVTEYRVAIKKIATGEVVVEQTTDSHSLDVPKIDSARSYVGRVTAVNSFGSCASPATQLRGTQRQTEAPLGLHIVRDPATPTRVAISWKAPEWASEQGLSGYRIYFRNHSDKHADYREVAATTLSLELDLEANKNWDIQIQALGSARNGRISKPVTLHKLGTATHADEANDPEVKIKEVGANVVVDINGKVGSNQHYPNLDIRIAPTMDGPGLRDQQLISNGSNQITFGAVPCGVYTVTVTGQGEQAAREFGRLVLNRCESDPVTSWRLMHGRAVITGNDVDFKYGGEARVISTVDRRSKDMVFTTDAKLVSGWGYGIWARADFNSESGVSGYSFQYDPGYGKVSTFGPALLLRVYQRGSECGSPIAAVKWPDGVDINASHHVVVVAQGDQLYASIDGLRVFEVASLKKALAASGCGFAEPSGTQVGFRVWSQDTDATFRNTTLS